MMDNEPSFSSTQFNQSSCQLVRCFICRVQLRDSQSFQCTGEDLWPKGVMAVGFSWHSRRLTLARWTANCQQDDLMVAGREPLAYPPACATG